MATAGVLGREQLGPYLQPLTSRLPFLGSPESKLDHLVTESVKRGPFQIAVTERGTLESFKNATLTCKVEGSTTIISIVKEGTHVKEGELVVELDSSALVDRETTQRIAVTSAKSSLKTAEENVEIQKTQNASDIAAAKLKLDLALIDLEKYDKRDEKTGELIGGEYKQLLGELSAAVTLAEETRAQAEEQYDFTERLVKKGYKTQNDLETARIARQKEQINVSIAKAKLEVLEEFTYRRTFTELKANAEEFAREIDRVKRKADAALAQMEAELASKTLTYEVEQNKHERLLQQIGFCKIYASQDGQVVYANSRDGRSSDQVLIEEGVTVRERQQLVILPDLNEMKVNARIHESRISLMREGLPATVKVDAFSASPFRGIVHSVASVPSSTGSSFNRDIKEYEAIVKLLPEENGEKIALKPGMTAQIEVLVESRDNVLQSPIQAVLTVVGKQFVFAVEGNKVVHKEVKVGKSNERMIEILDGVSEGNLVVMNPRSHFERELKELEAGLIKDQAAKPASAPMQLPEILPTTPPAGGPQRGPGASGAPTGSEGRPSGGGDPAAFFSRMDKNGDGKLAADEMSERFAERAKTMDKNGDGAVSLEEFKAAPPGPGAPGGRPRTGPGGEQLGGGS
ncbi:MAG TPA: HlyD family efflux transporter periplasmic adaptor subunit [Planctomycetaceae bacterium]|nr:HlyD family efflux transporter periplasmic adaptor subunit [Planctomycetaceae bacterium]